MGDFLTHTVETLRNFCDRLRWK